jgi:hypothetical protein
MLLPKKAWLTLVIFLFTFMIDGIAEAQAPLKTPKAAQLNKKKWKVIDGFRSAKFGMNERQLLRAISKDFNISKNKVKRHFNSSQKSKVLIIQVPNLTIVGGLADVVYILGYKSKKLVQVNIDWGFQVSKDTPPQEVLYAATLLQAHFIKRQYKKQDYRVNEKINETETLVFSGRDKKDRMIVLRLKYSNNKENGKKKEVKKNPSLILSYSHDVEKPDLFNAKAK